MPIALPAKQIQHVLMSVQGLWLDVPKAALGMYIPGKEWQNMLTRFLLQRY